MRSELEDRMNDKCASRRVLGSTYHRVLEIGRGSERPEDRVNDERPRVVDTRNEPIFMDEYLEYFVLVPKHS